MSNKLDIEIYPIPCSDYITIKVFVKLVLKVKVYIINHEGDVVVQLFEDYLKKGENCLKLEISMIKKGKYFILFDDSGKGVKMKKIVIE